MAAVTLIVGGTSFARLASGEQARHCSSWEHIGCLADALEKACEAEKQGGT